MPELPDLEAYLVALRVRLTEQELVAVRLGNPFLLRSVDPPPMAAVGRKVLGCRRLGKRLVVQFEGELAFVLHLMIAGRLHWKNAAPKLGSKSSLCALDFAHGSLLLSEAGTQRRASLHVVLGQAALAAHDPGGLEVTTATLSEFHEQLVRENHTLKRALTEARLFAGIGNAYSDEILFAARLSPFQRTRQLKPSEIERLFVAAQRVLNEWCKRLQAEAERAFPEKVTAFRPEMAVHGRTGAPCRVCQAPIQRVLLSQREFQYCARCQTGGHVLADRALSALLHEDWPRSIEELM